MTHEADELLKKALTLPPAERAELAGSLIESLDEVDEGSLQLGMKRLRGGSKNLTRER
jgi:hypothetical protein